MLSDNLLKFVSLTANKRSLQLPLAVFIPPFFIPQCWNIVSVIKTMAVKCHCHHINFSASRTLINLFIFLSLFRYPIESLGKRTVLRRYFLPASKWGRLWKPIKLWLSWAAVMPAVRQSSSRQWMTAARTSPSDTRWWPASIAIHAKSPKRWAKLSWRKNRRLSPSWRYSTTTIWCPLVTPLVKSHSISCPRRILKIPSKGRHTVSRQELSLNPHTRKARTSGSSKN